MGHRAALIFVVLLGLAGCLSGSSSEFDMTANAADMGQPAQCRIAVDISPSSAVAGATLTAVANAPGVSDIAWSVYHASDPAVTPMMLDKTNLKVTLDAKLPGSYQFVVTGQRNFMQCSGMASIDVHNPTGALAKYRLRALPPESAGLPLKDLVLPLYGGEPLSGIDVNLDSGTLIKGTVSGPGGAGIAGEVRLIAGDGPDAVATSSLTGAFTVAVRSDGTYQPLLIPQATTLAPHLGASDSGVNFAGAAFTVAAGEPVTGSVVDNAAAPVANARVVLRAGALPSGVGVTSAAGAFALRAEQQTYALSVGGDEWPIANAGGITVPAGGVDIAVAYNIARVAVGVSVVRADGTTPVAGARVTLSSRPLGTVANVTVGGVVTPAAGRVLRQLVTDGNGRLPSLQLPAGTYDLIVDPPAGSTPEGLTTITRTLAGAATWTLPLQPRIKLAGLISDGNGVGVGATQVTALELAGLGAAPATTTNSDGTYSLTIDAGAAVMLVIAPPASVKLAGAKVSLAAGTSRADVTLGAGLQVAGIVHDPSGAARASVIVEALCYACGSNTPITSGVTNANGEYKIYLPDPGTIIVDAGAD